MKRTIIHIDMDAFFASVEERDNPMLKGKPLIIGALPNERGVVSTCNYEARKYGVHSAMSIKEAYRRCPQATFMHGNMKKYEEASAIIHKIMLKYTDVIEFVALDEGYMDVTASLRIFGDAENIGRRLKKEIFDEVGVTCSVGISYSMMGAKLASEEKKPDGFFVLPDKESVVKLIRKRPVRVIHGIGEKTAEKLNSLGIVTVEDLINTPPEALVSLGKIGAEIQNFAMGNDNREVVADDKAKSIGREHTFQVDITEKSVLREVLLVIARDISLRAKRNGVFGRTITLKVKFCDMHTITRSKSRESTNSAKEIHKTVCEMLDSLKLKEPVRLIGIAISNITNDKTEKFAQLSLFDELEGKETARLKNDALEDTIFDIHTRYGRNILKTGKELEIQQKIYKREE